MLLPQCLDDSDDRILRVLDPEEDLHRGWVVLSAEAFQIFRNAAFRAV